MEQSSSTCHADGGLACMEGMCAIPYSAKSHSTTVAYLKEAYAKIGTGFGNDHCPSNVEAGNLQYGEVTYAGMEPLYQALRCGPDDVFYDLGSGTGKMVLYVALRGEASNSVGLEVGERRHRLAQVAGNNITRKLEESNRSESPSGDPMQCGNFSLRLADISRQHYQDPTVALFCNLCMDMSLTKRTLSCLLKCPSLKRLVSVTPMPPCGRLEFDHMVQVGCTWAKTTSWHVYNVLPVSLKQGPQAVWLAEMPRMKSDLPASQRRLRASSASTLEKVCSLELLGDSCSRSSKPSRRSVSLRKPRWT